MTEIPRQADARGRHRLIDALVGGGLALGLITAANAALPRLAEPPPKLAPTRPARAHRHTPAPAAAPPAPVVFIAFRDPAPGYPVISPFGYRQLPWEEAGRLHAGVDIAAPKGLPVLAAADGVVTRMAVDPGYGRFVEITHAGGLMTRYGHLSGYLAQLAPGVAVKAGQPIAEIGSTGTSTGSHLHFEIRDREDRPLNPALFLDHSFAAQADLPLKAAARIPRGVRTAYVSNIPRAKREAMQAKLEVAAAADAASVGAAGADRAVAANAADSAVDAAETGARVRGVHARPHTRFTPRA